MRARYVWLLMPALSRPSLLIAGTPKSAVHVFALAAAWFTFASSSIVFNEPAPVDALMIGLFLLLPLVGLFEANWRLMLGLVAWLIVGAGTAIAAFLSRDTGVSFGHSFVSFYLSMSCFVTAGFIAARPEQHTRLVLSGFLFAGLVAAVCGIIGYLGLVPQLTDIFTRYSRATGTFKDPNVFGPFLIVGLLTVVHQVLTRSGIRVLLPAIAGGILLLGILFSFSRGAWAAAAIAVVLYSYLFFITAAHDRERYRLVGIAAGGVALTAILLVLALRNEAIASLLTHRASLTQSYDVGAEGRFGGQLKAFGLILDNPLGIGAQIFAGYHHHEEVHNVYLSMFLNGGWLGGLTYLMIAAGTLGLGFRHALKVSHTQPLFLIAYAALAGNILEGVLIDSDHWRHYYHLMGIVWGLMAVDPRLSRSRRIIGRKGNGIRPARTTLRRAPRIARAAAI